MGKDVTIHVPSAVANGRGIPPGGMPPTAEQIVQHQRAELQLLTSELENQKIAAHTIANVAMALAARLIELGHGLDVDAVEAPFALRTRYDGGHLTITESGDGAYLLRIRERNAPAGIELAREDTT